MNILRIGITHFDQEGLELINSTFEEILLDEICTRTTYTSVGEEAIDEALNDWDEGNTDAIMVVPAKDDARLNPASLEGMDMIIWGNLRMAFVNEESDFESQMEMLHHAMKRDFDIDIPRITPILDAENYKAYDVVLVNDREQGLKDFLELSQGNGVAYTTGRELVCTSPFSAESFNESIYLAKDILNARERYDEAHKNPLPKLFVDKKDEIKKH
jgi:hypothetical protein